MHRGLELHGPTSCHRPRATARSARVPAVSIRRSWQLAGLERRSAGRQIWSASPTSHNGHHGVTLSYPKVRGPVTLGQVDPPGIATVVNGIVTRVIEGDASNRISRSVRTGVSRFVRGRPTARRMSRRRCRARGLISLNQGLVGWYWKLGPAVWPAGPAGVADIIANASSLSASIRPMAADSSCGRPLKTACSVRSRLV